MPRGIKTITTGLIGAVALSTAAMAGGIERGGYNIDLLFDPSDVVFDSSVTYVSPHRKLKNVVDTNPYNGTPGGATSVRDTEDYIVPRIGLKAGVGNADCMIDYSQPYGAHTNPGADWAGANSNIETKIESDGYAATCSYRFDAGKGQLRIIGGVSYLEISGFQEKWVGLVNPGPPPSYAGVSGVGRLDLSGSGYGWRAGLAYEIPEIAFRASLMYYSEVKLDEITGVLDLTSLPAAGGPYGLATPVFGDSAMPDVVELKVQSGIAPGWLAFGSVKWVDWSQLQVVSFCPTVTMGIPCTYNGGTKVTSLDLLYRDGWTVSGGVGHQFNDMVAGSMSLTWDRGTSTGLGTTTDTWTLAGGAAVKPNDNVELRLGGALGILTSGASGAVTTDLGTFGTDASYTFGNDLVAAIGGSAKIKF